MVPSDLKAGSYLSASANHSHQRKANGFVQVLSLGRPSSEASICHGVYHGIFG